MNSLRLACIALSLCALAAPCEASVTISTNATQNMSCSGGVCTPTAEKAILNVGDLANLLASGNLTMTSSSVAPDILFAAPFSWTSASRLTLDSYRSVVFQQALATAGPGALTILTNDGSSGRDYWFEKKGRIQFWG